MTPPAASRRILRLAAALTALWIGIGAGDAAAQTLPHHDLRVRLDPAARELQVDDTIIIHQPGQIEFALAPQFTVESILVDGAAVTAIPQRAPGRPTWWRAPLGGSPTTHSIVVRYRGRLEPLPDADHRGMLLGLPPIADPDGSFLPSGAGWYPEIGSGPFTYRLSLELPAAQRGLVPGRLIDERADGGLYRATVAFAHPAEGIDLVAGPYQVRERMVRRADAEPIRFRTYFHSEIADLSDEYLSAMGGYVDLYSRWIGPYPFTEFSVVSSPLPTGFGMPTFAYLGIRVLRLPFIPRTSLGHEILHNWWGNGVYVDFASGNWSEGLTAFMADYTYKEQEGPDTARDARLELLRDIAAIPPGQDTPLRRFTSRSHGTSQIVGYHKSTFLFLMLRDLLGTPVFDAGLQRFWREQRFRVAGWADLERAFEEVSGQKLDRFFDQWLSRSGAPRFHIDAARAAKSASGYRVWITLAQDDPAFTVTVPVEITTSTGQAEYRLDASGVRQEFALDVPARPEAVSLDPHFRVLRRLDPAEMPPILRQVIVDPATATIVASRAASVRAAAADLARALLDYPHALADAASWRGDSALLVIGLSADVDRFLARANLPGRPQQVGTRGTAQLWTAYQPNGKVLAAVSVESSDALRVLLRPLPHYGRQSYVIFEGPRAVDRGVWSTQPLMWRFADESK